LTSIKDGRGRPGQAEAISQEHPMSSLHITPYLAMVIAGFSAFIVALAYGRMRSMGDDDQTKS
jgi:hypothetical protein